MGSMVSAIVKVLILIPFVTITLTVVIS